MLSILWCGSSHSSRHPTLHCSHFPSLLQLVALVYRSLLLFFSPLLGTFHQWAPLHSMQYKRSSKPTIFLKKQLSLHSLLHWSPSPLGPNKIVIFADFVDYVKVGKACKICEICKIHRGEKNWQRPLEFLPPLPLPRLLLPFTLVHHSPMIVVTLALWSSPSLFPFLWAWRLPPGRS